MLWAIERTSGCQKLVQSMLLAPSIILVASYGNLSAFVRNFLALVVQYFVDSFFCSRLMLPSRSFSLCYTKTALNAKKRCNVLLTILSSQIGAAVSDGDALVSSSTTLLLFIQQHSFRSQFVSWNLSRSISIFIAEFPNADVARGFWGDQRNNFAKNRWEKFFATADQCRLHG